MSQDYESERTATRVEAAAALSGVVDGLLAGSLRLGEGDRAVTVDAPEELSLEVELETEDGEVSLELELEWPEDAETSAVDVSETDLGVSETETDASETGADDSPTGTDSAGTDAGTDGAGTDTETGADEPAVTDLPETETGAADDSQSLARFELFEDRGGEWRWRLRHRNGNIIATSGEGYTRKHNAWKGLQSVVRNAPGADHIEESTD
jgi:amphi-Trp domain-containing protein